MEKMGHPRPDFVREDWFLLDGDWDFSFDEPTYDKKIRVPFCFQAEKSGIGDLAFHPIVWYRKTFFVDEAKIKKKRLVLKFGAVDYEAEIYINERLACVHRGGHTSFETDITPFVKSGENLLTVKAKDFNDRDKPRGKQVWTENKFGCWYTPTTGIWQSVWLEYVGEIYIKRIKITPDLEHNLALCEVFISSMKKLEGTVHFRTLPADDGCELDLGQQVFCCENGYGKTVLPFPDWDVRRERIVWSPETPNLVEADVRLADDRVATYFGMRSIDVKNGTFVLNGSACFMRLVLDQGYWKESLLTPPDEEAIKKDILLAKEMGFNGARKHQKIEDPRYYYWADRLGFLVWGELPSCYMFTDNTVENAGRELMEFVERDYNHPSIVAWVTSNESWGMRNIRSDIQLQNFSNYLIYLAKALDRTRPVSGNDGWEQTEHTDIVGIHDYELMPETLYKYQDMEKLLDGISERRQIMADNQRYRGQPIVLTEYGGIAISGEGEGWGYYNKVRNEDEFFRRLEPITDFLIKSGQFAGFCYTQLTDVMQEVNGLLREDRTLKFPAEKLRMIFAKKRYE